MQAAWYEKIGPAKEVLQVGELDDPVPSNGEVRVKLWASGLNPSDVKNRAGQRGELKHPRQIPNSDGAGVVDMVGNNANRDLMGKRVWVFNAAFQRADGTCAEYVCLPETQTIPMPQSLDFYQGACLGIPVMTAHRCVFADGSVSGKHVFVVGGAGVVGHYAIQLAKWGGATVLTTVSSRSKAQHAAEAGADYIINYKEQDVTKEIEEITSGVGVDRIVEVEGETNLENSLRIIKPDIGVVVIYGSSTGKVGAPFLDTVVRNPIIRPVLVYTMSDQAKRAAQDDIEKWVSVGNAKFAIAKRFPLNQIIEAHEYIEQGEKIGHVILEIPHA